MKKLVFKNFKNNENKYKISNNTLYFDFGVSFCPDRRRETMAGGGVLDCVAAAERLRNED